MARTLNWNIGYLGSVTTFANRNPAACVSWGPYGAVYDVFRVNSMSVTLGFPLFAEVPPTGVATPHAVLFGYDNDSVGGPATFADGIESSTAVVMEAKGLQRVKYLLPTGMVTTSSVGTSVVSSEWCDVSINTALMGGVWCAVDSLATSGSSPLNVRVVVEFDVEFKYRL